MSLNKNLKAYMYVGPRRCGKTEMAFNLFTACPIDTAMYVFKEGQFEDVEERLKTVPKPFKMYVVSETYFADCVDISALTYAADRPVIIFDDYLEYSLENRVAMYQKTHYSMNHIEVQAFTTPTHLYDSNLIDQIRGAKIKNKGVKVIASSASKHIKELFYNYLTDENVDIQKIHRPVWEKELLEYAGNPEELLTKGIGEYEKRKV